MKPFWVTFYSYKGGVGRSLALANVAALLVKRGRRVVLIDFDLEAPGLDSFTEFAPSAGKSGVVEYVSEFIRHKAAPDILPFIHRCELPGPLRGELFVMPAGKKDAAYNHQLNRIDWAELYDSGLGGPFFANWKATIDQQFQPDYVFVDSRTGLTEVGGVCTTQFPDLVMMLFGLNEQNVRGVATVAQSIREADPDRVPQIHFVATPVPNFPSDQRGIPNDKRVQERRSQLAERMDAAAELFGVKITSSIRYYPPASLSEKLFVLEQNVTRQSIYGDYERLCEQITKFNRSGLDFLIEQADEAIVDGDITRIARVDTVLERDYSNRADAIFTRARFEVARNKTTTAIDLAEKAFLLDPAFQPAFHFLSSHFTREQQHDRVLSLFEILLLNRDRIPIERWFTIQQDMGHTLMALGRYSEAESYYADCLNHAATINEPAALMMVHGFNYAEAHRRASGIITPEAWQNIVRSFGPAGVSSDAASPEQANRWQAMHIAYAATGDTDAARDALRKARRSAEGVGEIEDIFTVKSYRMVPVAEFIAINDEMLAALDRDELWDGMKLIQRQ